MTTERIDLGVDELTGIHKFEVRDVETGRVIGYDHVAPSDLPLAEPVE